MENITPKYTLKAVPKRKPIPAIIPTCDATNRAPTRDPKNVAATYESKIEISKPTIEIARLIGFFTIKAIFITRNGAAMKVARTLKG
jgi:hypothetical protein